MKKFLHIVLACSMLLSLSSCDWFNTTILGKPSKAEIAKRIRIENQRKDSLARVEQHAALMRQQQLEAEAAERREGEVQQGQHHMRYHVIIGCFRKNTNAERMMSRLQSQGYHPTSIKFKNGFDCISAQAFSDIHAAFNAMNALMRRSDFAPGDIWVYDTHQRLHVQ